MKATPVDMNWHPGLPIFASERFLKAVGDECGWLGGLDQQGNLRCILPFTVVKKSFLRLARFRVETILLSNDLDPAEERNFLESAVGYLARMHVDMIIPATTNAIFRAYPRGAIAAPYGTYILDLARPESELWQGLSASHRRKIRLAIKSGVRIRAGSENLMTAYALVRDTFARSRMGFMAERDFHHYVESLGDNVQILVAEHDGKVQASIVIPFSLHSAYFVYGGSIMNPVTGAANLLHWEAIRMFRDLKVRRYDFVGVRIRPEPGSKQEGLAQFKQRFGATLVQGFMWKYPVHWLGSAAYTLAARLTRGGDIVDAERHKLGSG